MIERICVVEGCGKLAHGLTWCSTHYHRVAKHGSVDLPARPTQADRFWAKVNKTETCWLWTAAKLNTGYGVIRQDYVLKLAHRVAYEMVVGPIPEGLCLDHLCRTPPCVRPDHLEAVTMAENLRRADNSASTVNSRKTHCPQGHAYADHGRVGKKGQRICRICDGVRVREWRTRTGR